MEKVKEREKNNYDDIKIAFKDGVLMVNGIKNYNGQTEGIEASLKYYKVDFVPILDKFYYEYADELIQHVKELVELENGINFKDNKEIAIILNDYELEEFIHVFEQNREVKILYLGHDVLPTSEQEAFFVANNIKVNIIPDYYYQELRG